ncbi:TIGR03915 family putative DNA repair protein [Mitsuaria sp. 7]|uniref:TIGR03915 family putative DNA repair protein n=1 Tax=Mitsuaria sp. 7 TaxID=1658665 RepID=UPI0009EE109C|nr:TIGR03915 family putative DNA repair protein [Mitsuaria sp. 7]
MVRVQLDGPIDLDGFRQAAKRLMALGIPPSDVVWTTGHESDGLWGEEAHENGPALAELPLQQEAQAGSSPVAFTVPAAFLSLCRTALLHTEPQRFTLLYRMLFRLKTEPGYWRDTLDADRRRAERLEREVRHEIHKTHAFVRFVPVQDADGERLVAWFEPTHHTLEAAAPFFARRFANLRWAILSPRCSVSWDGATLQTGPGGRREDAPPPDAGAELWLTYYRSIFNPARLKVAMMEREMPRRYWANLPEAALIEPLVAQAEGRVQTMLDAGPTSPRRIREIERARRPSAATPAISSAQVDGSGAGDKAADSA